LIEEVAQDDPRVLLAAEILTRLLDRPKPKREREPHTRLLRGIFDAYDQVRVRAPAPGMNRPFRGFLDAVLVAFRLGPIDDDGLIGEDDLRGALHHWRKTAHR